MQTTWASSTQINGAWQGQHADSYFQLQTGGSGLCDWVGGRRGEGAKSLYLTYYHLDVQGNSSLKWWGQSSSALFKWCSTKVAFNGTITVSTLILILPINQKTIQNLNIRNRILKYSKVLRYRINSVSGTVPLWPTVFTIDEYPLLKSCSYFCLYKFTRGMNAKLQITCEL